MSAVCSSQVDSSITAFLELGKGDTRVRGEFIVVRLPPLSEITVVLVGLTFCGTRTENSEPMKKYILSALGIFVAMAFIASCQQEGTTVTEEPANGPPAYMNRPAPSPTR
jgi:hypothetical protein